MTMVVPDLDVVKDIPGYKVVLKTLIKWQIQQLVEQLAVHTNEESVILTASVADGTLSHLGSDSGKGFLEDHEDFKSQFLGFCLKRQHKIQLEEEEKRRKQAMIESIQQMSGLPQFGYSSPAAGKYPSGQYSTRNTGSAGQRVRSPGVRHEPYPKQRYQRKAVSLDPPQPLKHEPSNASKDGVCEQNNINQSTSQSALTRDEDISNTSSSTIPNEISESSACTTNQDMDQFELDPNVLVKIENESEAHSDLEITGVDLGDPHTSQQWDPNTSYEMNFDFNSGATGVADDTQTGHDIVIEPSMDHNDLKQNTHLASQRYKSLNNSDILELESYKDATNTQRVIKRSVGLFREFLGKNSDFEKKSKAEINESLRMFYASIRQLNGKELKKKSLDSLKYGISKYLKEQCKIDIKNDPEFVTSQKMFKAKCKDLRKKGLDNIEHTPDITEEDLSVLCDPYCEAFDINTPSGLQRKVWFDLIFHLCQKGETLRQMTKSTFEVATDAGGKVYIRHVEVENCATSSQSDSACKARLYSRTGCPMCPVATFKKYLQKLHPQTDVLWQRAMESFKESDDTWYTNAPLGKNTLAKIMSEISRLGKLSKIYTNYSLRTTSVEKYEKVFSKTKNNLPIGIVKEELPTSDDF